jgi:Flp pilus assembly protein TadG
MLSRCSKFARRFADDCQATVAITFTLVAIVIFLIVGLALDFGRAVQASTRIEAALDSAALAGAKALRLQGKSESEAKALAETVFNTNMLNTGADAAVIKSLKVQIDTLKSEVTVSAESEVPTYFGGLVNVNQFTFDKSATALFEADDVEIALQLDTTGSMCAPCTKISDLKDAVNLLVDAVISDKATGQKVRVAIAPYSAGVNAGSFASAVTAGTNGGSTCVFERKIPALQDSDTAPIGNDSLRGVGDLPGGANAPYCPGTEVLPLTDDKDVIKATVQSLSTGGVTAGHLGTAFASYLLSPNWSGVWQGASVPANYGKGTQKFAVLMTDGEYNTFNGRGINNGTKQQSRSAAKDTCTAMKARGITVYTVGFMLTDPDAIDVMNDCASTPATAFFAEDGDALKAAFSAIANQILTLRLTN